MMWHDVDGMGWWMLWGAFMMIFFWGGLIALAVWVVRSFSDGRESDGGESSRSRALIVAEERYARGEISREEFLRIKTDLTAT